MQVSNQPDLKFQGVDIINIRFNTEKPYDGSSEINLDVQPKVFYPKDSRTEFKIFMEVSMKCEGFFDLNLVGIGNFKFDEELNDEKRKKSFMNTNAPAIMFPYLRAFITTLTSNLGEVTGPLVIPTQFFKGELEEIKMDDYEE
jgi:preprotein translocase subunit SecB